MPSDEDVSTCMINKVGESNLTAQNILGISSYIVLKMYHPLFLVLSQAPGCPDLSILSFNGGFHGRTMGT